MTKTTPDKVSEALRAKFVLRWSALNKTRAGVDFDLGVLARDIRRKHVAGASGDYQFRSWVVKRLDVGISTARKLLTASQAVDRFNREDWETLGDWRVVQFVMHLPAKVHDKLLVRAREFFSQHHRSPSYQQMRSFAFDLNARSKVHGRPLRSETEEKLNTLRSWIDLLYRKHKSLPQMTGEVQDAMRGTRLRGVV